MVYFKPYPHNSCNNTYTIRIVIATNITNQLTPHTLTIPLQITNRKSMSKNTVQLKKRSNYLLTHTS